MTNNSSYETLLCSLFKRIYHKYIQFYFACFKQGVRENQCYLEDYDGKNEREKIGRRKRRCDDEVEKCVVSMSLET